MHTRRRKDAPNPLRLLERRVSRIEPAPGEIPRLRGIDIHGRSIQKQGRLGGDHIIFVDFNQRYDLRTRIADRVRAREAAVERVTRLAPDERSAEALASLVREEHDGIIAKLELNTSRGGLLLADVKGHDYSSSFIYGMLHQAFLLGTLYELDTRGEITTNLFEQLNTRFHNSSSIDDFITVIYGEIHENGTFRFISAGHERPVIFSREFGRFVDIPEELVVNVHPLGLLPSEEDVDIDRHSSLLKKYKPRYTTNELRLMSRGDVLLLYSDGLSEHARSRDGVEETYFPSRLEELLKSLDPEATARETFDRIKEDVFEFRPDIEDDLTFLVIKKT